MDEAHTSRRAALGALALGGAATAALAASSAAQASTPDEFTARGVMKIGVVSGAPPFGIIDEKGAPAGYDTDVAGLIAKYMGVKAEIVPLVPPARIPALQSKRVDVLVSTLAPTPERAKTVAFTMPYSTFRLSILGAKNLEAKALTDLKGKKIAVPRGTTQDTALTRMALPGTSLVRFDDDATCAQAVFSGQVDAAAMPDTAVMQVMEKNAGANAEFKFAFALQPNSMAVRKDQMELHQWLNNTIWWLKNSGELNEVSQKWLKTPLPDLPVF